MKYKKVSEYPLPLDTYKTRRFLIKLPDGKVYFTDTPSIYNAFDGAEWCEFNPDEIEPAEYNEKWLTDKEHQIKMDLERINREILDHCRSDKLNKLNEVNEKIKQHFTTFPGAVFQNASNPDEIESSEGYQFPAPQKITDYLDDIDKERIFETEPSGDYNLDKIFHSALRSSVKIVEPKEPSWEEKFRWETAAKLFCSFPIACAINKGPHQPEIDANYSVQCVDILIEQLKRGRE